MADPLVLMADPPVAVVVVEALLGVPVDMSSPSRNDRSWLLSRSQAARRTGVMIGIGAMAPIRTEVPVTSVLTEPISVAFCMSQTDAT